MSHVLRSSLNLLWSVLTGSDHLSLLLRSILTSSHLLSLIDSLVTCVTLLRNVRIRVLLANVSLLIRSGVSDLILSSLSLRNIQILCLVYCLLLLVGCVLAILIIAHYNKEVYLILFKNFFILRFFVFCQDFYTSLLICNSKILPSVSLLSFYSRVSFEGSELFSWDFLFHLSIFCESVRKMLF